MSNVGPSHFPYLQGQLPFIIGSDAFNKEKYVGMLDED